MKTYKKAQHDPRILDQPWLEVVTDTDFNRKLNRIDPGYFAVVNHQYSRPEIHSLKNKSSDTLCLVVEDFSDKTISRIWDTRVDRVNHRTLKDHNEKFKKKRQREIDNDNFAIASEWYDEAHLYKDHAELHDSYRNKHYMSEVAN